MTDLQSVQALVEECSKDMKEDAYVKICNALRAAYEGREKVLDVVITHVSAKVHLDCDGDPDVTTHVWTNTASLTCTPLSDNDRCNGRGPLELLLNGFYRPRWTENLPFIIHVGDDVVTITGVRPAKRPLT